MCLAYVGYLARTQSAHPHTLANYKLLRVGCQHGAVVIYRGEEGVEISELKFIRKLYHIHISNHLDRFWLRCYSKYIAIYSQMYTMLYTRYVQTYDVICKLQLVEQFAYVARSQ